MKQSIKETKELIAATKLLAVSAAKISKDGLNAADIPQVVQLATNFKVIVDGLQGLDLIDDELKDLEKDELIELIQDLHSLVKEVKEVV